MTDDNLWLEIGWDKNRQRVEALQRELGIRRVEPAPWLTAVTRDAARHFALGIGDGNPRWFARDGGGEAVIAPPSLLYAASPAINATCCPAADGWQWLGASWRWHRPLVAGLIVSATAWVEAIDVADATEGGETYTIRRRAAFHDAGDALIAEVETRETSCLVGGARDRPAVPLPTSSPPYDLDDIVDIYAVYAAEAPRGSLSFDDVAVGDSLPVMAKGPITPSATIAYLQGIGGMAAAGRLAWKAAQRRPYDAPENAFGVSETQDRVHWDGAFARRRGLPGASPPASARSCWLIHQITDWIGDGAMVCAAECSIVSPDPEGETLLIHGKVADRFVEDGRQLVRITQRGERRDGSVSVTGTALVELPVQP